MAEVPRFRDACFRVGLTGGIASGKSTVAQLFAARGVPVIDLDELAREIVAPEEPGLEAVVREFGPEVLDAAGQLDRQRLRTTVFGDPSARKRLEDLLHPLILEATVREAERAGGPYQLLVVPLLVESGLTGWVDRVLVIDCLPETQLDRLLARDQGDEALARNMVAAQAGRRERLAAADDIVSNDGPEHELTAAVETLDAAYREMAAGVGRARPGLRLP
jgi:dephospho-CoA kinase